MNENELTPEAKAALDLVRDYVASKVNAHKKLDVTGELEDSERKFVEAYLEHCDVKRAKLEAGVRKDMRKDVIVNLAIQQGMDQLGEESKLRAIYVRDYIYDVLELCPTDHFFPAPNGDWCIDPQSFACLPHEVKRLVESIEYRTLARGETFFKVNFVSKKAALAMAARYTLVERHSVKVAQLPWEELMKAEQEAQVTVEQKLAELRNGHTNNGSNGHADVQ